MRGQGPLVSEKEKGPRYRAELVVASALCGINLAIGQLGTAADQRRFVDMYRAGGSGEVRAFRLVLVAETDAQAADLARVAAEVYPPMRGGQSPTPQSVAGQILQFKAECDVDRVDLLAHIPGLSHAAVQQTLSLYASAVAPLVGVRMLTPSAELVNA